MPLVYADHNSRVFLHTCVGHKDHAGGWHLLRGVDEDRDRCTRHWPVHAGIDALVTRHGGLGVQLGESKVRKLLATNTFTQKVFSPASLVEEVAGQIAALSINSAFGFFGFRSLSARGVSTHRLLSGEHCQYLIGTDISADLLGARGLPELGHARRQVGREDIPPVWHLAGRRERADNQAERHGFQTIEKNHVDLKALQI